MLTARLPWWLIPMLTFAVSSGCAKTEPAAEPEAAAATGPALTKVSNSQSAAAANFAQAPGGKKSDAARSNLAAKGAPPETPKDAFTPPNQKRLDVFRRPNVAMSKTARAEKQAGGVELKGFVNAEKLKAVLVIEGQIAMVTQGEQRGDLEVIEVKPPQVILQRGRNRWTIAMFDSGAPASDENAPVPPRPVESTAPASELAATGPSIPPHAESVPKTTSPVEAKSERTQAPEAAASNSETASGNNAPNGDAEQAPRDGQSVSPTPAGTTSKKSDMKDRPAGGSTGSATSGKGSPTGKRPTGIFN